ncbi:MAG: 5'-nucleotidase C-terminal domain-containing protein [Saprospiraceae bacterium]|nr:5'-nucleotidase C-terminal domain-containing protein [Saprospiraceae bacterium]MBK8669994.1 5'-nucleotidase C-terminal domain-containing protein [Saprospiraceae bacterium]
MKIKIIFLLLVIVQVSCSKQYHLADIQSRGYRIEKASYPVDVKVATIIEPYKLKLDETMNVVIGYCEQELTKGKPSSSLTNWFADALLDESQKLVSDKLDFAVQNYGGIRVPFLTKGDVTVGKIYELMPFDNIMYIQELKGSIVQQFFDKMAESGGWPISHTVSFDIAYGKASNILINGIPLDTNRIYNAAIPDYIANGGDNMTFLKDAKTNNTGALLRDMLISHVKGLTAKGKNITANQEKRIKD